MGPRRNMKMFQATCLFFIFLGLLTIFFLVSKLPIIITLICFFTCCAGLLFQVIYGFYIIWCSLAKKAHHQIHEGTPLRRCSDLEAQYNHGDSPEATSHNLRRSSPVTIPSRRPGLNNAGFIPWLSSRPCLASVPWIDSSLTSKYLDDRQKYVSHERRHTLSENVPINELNETPKISRNHTLSESAVYDLEEA